MTPAPIDRGATALGDEQYAPASDIPPQIFVAIAGEEPSVYTLTKDVITIGRSEDNDIVISSKIVSRRHAQLERVGSSYQFITSPDAGNPVLFEGRPLQEADRKSTRLNSSH